MQSVWTSKKAFVAVEDLKWRCMKCTSRAALLSEFGLFNCKSNNNRSTLVNSIEAYRNHGCKGISSSKV